MKRTSWPLGGGKWFRITGGEHEGRLHLSGWMGSAIKGEGWGPSDDGWMGFAHCPVCFAMVQSETPRPGQIRAYGDLIWNHERWHARTDHPVPPELLMPSDLKDGFPRPVIRPHPADDLSWPGP